MSTAATERAYRLLTGEDTDERACRDIPDALCTSVPRNFFLNLGNGAATKLAEQIASPGLVLPWLLSALGAPAALIGFLVPIRQTGALLPQMMVAAQIRAVAVRKWFWAGAGLVQALALLLVVLAAVALPPAAAGIAVLVLLAVFSLASGVGSVAFQDVMGKTIPKGRRGRLLAWRATAGGVLTLMVAFPLQWLESDSDSLAPVLLLITAAALLWAVAAACFALIDETPGATEGGRNTLTELRAGLELVRRVPGFRSFLYARGLLVVVEVAAPWYALQAQALYGSGAGVLALYVLALGLASVLSSPVWGRFADLDPGRVMTWSAIIAVAAGLVALVLAFAGGAATSPVAYTPVFLLIGIAEAGVRLGRKTYLVDAAPKEERALYVAFSNTLMGLLALAAGLLGAVAQFAGLEATIALLVLLSALAAVAGLRLPPAVEMAAAKP